MHPNQQKLVDAISQAISQDPLLSDYKNFRYYLKQKGMHWYVAVLLDNKYLYGSLVAQAKKQLLNS